MSVTIDAGCCIGPAAARSLPRRKRTILASETRLSVTLQQEDAQATVCGNSGMFLSSTFCSGCEGDGDVGEDAAAVHECWRSFHGNDDEILWSTIQVLMALCHTMKVIDVVNFKALRGMPCVPFATRAAPPPTQEELVEAPEVRPHEGGDTYSKKKPKLGVHKVFRSITARVDCGTKEGHGGDGSGARSPRGKEHVMVTVANPTVGKTPVHGR
ncbi:hypothetical protein OPV22_029755 [Ensete ventricosum]|uniref:Uncharacterized protein n=1 Tax=Ensete ventricosum TaxID=4639 RepID=A0AAV8QA51_ENSVE|nr:hypothetical protein OPV22_029755 [Ensete ventricosum]